VKKASPVPPVLHLSKEEVDTPEKRAVYTISLVGCGQKALFYGLAFAEVGFKVACSDADQSVIKRVSRGNFQLGDRQTESKLKSLIRADKIEVTSDLKAAVSNSDILIITINARIDSKKNPDYSELESICKQVGASLKKGSLVIFAGVAGFGVLQSVVKETLENTAGLKVGEDFGLAYSPSNSSSWDIQNQTFGKELKVAANDKYSLTSAVLIFETIAKHGVRKISDVKIAEVFALFSAVSRDVSNALANELAILCENAKVDYIETLRLAEGTCNFIAPNIEEEENRAETYFLIDDAENLNTKIRLPILARQVNEEMVKHALNLTQDALHVCEKTLRRAKVALLGAVVPGTGAATFIELLEAKGAKISRYDPLGVGSEQPEETTSVKKTLNETVEGADCVIILKEQEQFKRLNLKKLKAIMKSPAALIDLAGLVEPEKAENEGFIYRGIGRGVWRK
jgi:UDP-N-acetyl-D-mannosaminuronic acid dehydrogenase